MGAHFYALQKALPTLPTVSLKSEKFEMDLGRLAPASEVAERHTLPF
jgi:hypothetical protein